MVDFGKNGKKSNFRKYITALATECRNYTFSGEYEMDIEWMENEKDGDLKGECVAAEMVINGKYLTFTLRIYPQIKRHFQNRDYDKICKVLMHEMCHLLTEPLYMLAWQDSRPSEERVILEVRERQTQRICNAIMLGISEDFYLPQKLLK